jgi:hypothetical protein
MYNPIAAYFAHRERMAEIKAEVTNKPFTVLLQAVESQSNLLKDWLAGFRSTTLPATTTVRDSDEYAEEEKRERTERLENWERVDPHKLFPNMASLLDDRK